MRVDGVTQRLAQMLVELDHVHVRDPLGEVLGEHAQAAADLQHDILVPQLGGALDHAEDVRVDQEVLPQLAVGADPELPHPAQAGLDWCGRVHHEPTHQPNTRAALRSTIASSSANDTPRSSAMNAAVWATNAG